MDWQFLRRQFIKPKEGGGEQKFIDDFLFKLWNLKLSS